MCIFEFLYFAIEYFPFVPAENRTPSSVQKSVRARSTDGRHAGALAVIAREHAENEKDDGHHVVRPVVPDPGDGRPQPLADRGKRRRILGGVQRSPPAPNRPNTIAILRVCRPVIRDETVMQPTRAR